MDISPLPDRPGTAPRRTPAFAGGRHAPRSSTGLPAGGGGSPRTRAVGAYGERVAADHLHRAGLVVVDRNWRCEAGEADLVAVVPSPRPAAAALGTTGHPGLTGGPCAPTDATREQLLRTAQTVVVCEVKTRTSTAFGPPASQVPRRKVATLRRVAVRWLREHPQVGTRSVRIDVIGVLVPTAGAPRVSHLQGVS